MAILGYIGTGNMGGALAEAAAKNPGYTLLLANRHPEKAYALLEKTGGRVTDNLTVAREADYIYLGVKPGMLDDVAAELREVLAARETPFTVVSMLAGTTVARVQEALGGSYPVIRILPNIPVAVGEGVTLYVCGENVTGEQKAEFLDSMKYAGLISETDEAHIDAASCVAGCGPAYAALFIEALADGGVACGLPRGKAMEYALQMVIGTAKLLQSSGQHPGVLKDAVCSPGGSTIQGVRALENGGFRAAVTEAVIASYEKTLEMGK